MYMLMRRVEINNLDGRGPGGGDPIIRYAGVARDAGRSLDLIISTDGHYFPADPQLTGTQGNFGNINVRSGTSTDLNFEFVDSATGQPVVVDDLLLKFFDVDEGGSDDLAHTIIFKGGCEEFYKGKDSVLITRGNCDPGTKDAVIFRKPTIAEPGCHRRDMFDLDLSRVVSSNLAGKGPDVQHSEELRFQGAATIRGAPIDLVLQVQPDSGYEPASTLDNGFKGNFGHISLLPGTMSHFKARFVRSGTNTPFRMPKFNFTFFDVDQPSGVVRERVQVSGFTKWYHPNGLKHWRGKVAFHHTEHGPVFTSTQINVTDPSSPETRHLTPEQEAVTVQFHFQDTAEFPFGLQVIQTGPFPGHKKGRNFMFAGKYCLPDYSKAGRQLSPSPGPTPAAGAAEAPARQLQSWFSPNVKNPTQPPTGATPSGAPAPQGPLGLPGLPYSPAQPPRQSPLLPREQCHGATKPDVKGVGPAALSAEQEARAVAVRFRGVSKAQVTLAVDKGCGHNFLFAGKVCVSGKCDPCGTSTSCKFADWQPWGKCSAECDGGSMNRSRDVMRVPRGRNGGECGGAIESVRSCNTHSCKKGCRPVDCRWGSWAPWSVCSKCGGQKTRRRTIEAQPDCGGRACEPMDAEEIERCPRNCKGEKTYCVWAHWTAWTPCSVTCGSGRKARRRTVRITHEKPPDFQAKFREYNRLEGRLHNLQTQRIQVMVLSFTAGCLSFVAVLMAFRSCSRARSDYRIALVRGA